MRGHIKKRANGTWSIVVYMGRDPKTGKKIYQWQTVKGTKSHAEKELAALINRKNNGSFVKPTKTTVGTFLESWLETYASCNTAPRTFERYSQIVRLHLTPNLGRIELTQLRPEHIQAYYSKALSGGRVSGGGLSAQTVKHHHRVLSEALNHAVKWGLLARNVAMAVDPPRPEKREMHTIAPEDMSVLFEEAAKMEKNSGLPYELIFMTALHTGMRRGEILALRWSDIDLAKSKIYVRCSLQCLKNGEIIIREPKTPGSRRLVSMTPSLLEKLIIHKESSSANMILQGKTLQGDSLVFAHFDGTPINPNTVSPAFAKIAKRAGLNLRLHDLRHSHATLMLTAGVHPKIVSERLGHSTVAFTLDTYSHVIPGLQDAAAKTFEKSLHL
ncbi:tyrosine-type recombinase/integrase [Dehalococcoides mccartyi]|uniref:Site-specific recombinase, phage integrase family n=1 Tax=Dehalococcoides mccartyi (strain VS) TaxID=311424 RepID=D2BJR0_DEHMV|nr:tyrosine-type recombinase/integrase [Dehalococcoides mccartyi]ACZ62560.1 site-specific recombinase, phage integrase family [Dehalococcoides mccartyi VS]